MSAFGCDIRRLLGHLPRRILGGASVPESRRIHMRATAEKSADATAIRPLTGETPQADLDDLRARIEATRWPEKEPVEDQSQGVQLAAMQALARYWATDYDWRRCEEKLDDLPHFMTEIDGLDIHFIHVRSEHEDALPMIVTHGWPGSVVEQLKIIEPLTNPTAHGASASDAFHLVIPSMPGYGFSGKPTETGWGPARIASAWIELMRRLGYTRFVAQGGDWGGLVVDQMAVQAPPELLGIHTNQPGALPADVNEAVQSGGPAPSGLSDEETRAYENLKDFFATDVAYAQEMGTRPQTMYGVADSPIGLAAWMIDHDMASYALIARVFVDGAEEGLSRDDILDNITLYWLTNTGVSSGRLYWENKLGFFDVKGVEIPVAVSVFPDEIDAISHRWAEHAYPKLIHYNKVDKGGHFAAWEQPELFVEEVRTGLRSLR
jgi:pimeloyl-ACP methyl ester carboxylesterase